MKRAGPIPSRCAARLLYTAAMLDLTALLVLAISVTPAIAGAFRQVPELAITAGLVAIGLPVMWVITEILLGGWSPGRWVLGLELCCDEGKPMPRGRKFNRAMRKIMSLGVTGLNPARPARYDRATRAVWHSPMAPRKAGPMPEWRLRFLSGALRGKASRLGKIPSFAKSGAIRFGRDRGWADVKLIRDQRVSGQHCILFVKSGQLYLRDGNEAGAGSSNGTFLEGRKLAPGEVRAVGTAQSFSIANVKVSIDR